MPCSDHMENLIVEHQDFMTRQNIKIPVDMKQLPTFYWPIIGGSGILEEDAKHVVAYASIAIGFLAICGLIVWNVFIQVHCKVRKLKESSSLLIRMYKRIHTLSHSLAKPLSQLTESM